MLSFPDSIEFFQAAWIRFSCVVLVRRQLAYIGSSPAPRFALVIHWSHVLYCTSSASII